MAGSAQEIIRRALANQSGRITGQGLGKQPDLSYLRRGADSLPSRSLGGPFNFPDPLHRLYNNPHGATKWENDAYEMWKLAEMIKQRRGDGTNPRGT